MKLKLYMDQIKYLFSYQVKLILRDRRYILINKGVYTKLDDKKYKHQK